MKETEIEFQQKKKRDRERAGGEQTESEREVTATVWWWLTRRFTVRSGYAVEAGAQGTGQALYAGALSLPRSLSSPLRSHTAPAPPAVRQSDCEGVAAQRGYIKGPERWEAQGLILAHNKVAHKSEAEMDSFKKAVPFSEKGIGRTKHFILLPKPALCQPRIQQPRQDSFLFPRSPWSSPFSAYSQWPPRVCEQER